VFEAIYHNQDPKLISQMLYSAADKAATNPNFRLSEFMDVNSEDHFVRTIHENWKNEKISQFNIFFGGLMTGIVLLGIILTILDVLF
jgi:hypothetical protein